MKFKLDASEFKFRALEFFTRCVAVFCISREFSATFDTFRTAPAKRFTRKHKKRPKRQLYLKLRHTLQKISRKSKTFSQSFVFGVFTNAFCCYKCVILRHKHKFIID